MNNIHHRLRARKFRFRHGLALHYNLNGKKRTLYVYPREERQIIGCHRKHGSTSASYEAVKRKLSSR